MPNRNPKGNMGFPIDSYKTKKKMPKGHDEEGLWSEEVKALDDIRSGKTKMVVQDGEDFLKELDEFIAKS